MSEINGVRKTRLFELYEKLFSEGELSIIERQALLSIAFECINNSDSIAQGLGYRIVLAYALKFNDFRPLLDVAAKEGYAPLVSSVFQKLSDHSKDRIGAFSLELLRSSVELYQNGGVTLTNDQWEIRQFFSDNLGSSISISAPTSFGKSEMMIEYCKENSGNSICIVVPTKSLISQTRRRILSSISESEGRWHPTIVTHPDANTARLKDKICVYTQERLFRHFILHQEEVFPDLLIDEAHNIFSSDSRGVLLSQAIILHESRARSLGVETKIKYFTPFLVDPENVQARYLAKDIEGASVTRSVKSERYYIADLKRNNRLSLYDQFFDKMVDLQELEMRNVEEYIIKSASKKNIVYQNRPIKMEAMVKNLVRRRRVDAPSDSLSQAANAIREYIHEDYLLAQSLEAGIVYHHGSVPDIIKLYVEDLFSQLDDVDFILCSSTLLEGVNIPATRLFLPTVSIGKGVMNASQFKNLVGRVCRYKEVFGGDFDPELLMPEIHLVVNSEYMHRTINPKNFMSQRLKVDLKLKDENKNPLIELNRDRVPENEMEEAETFLDVIDPTARQAENINTAKTSSGYKAFVHNIRDVDILLHEEKIEEELNKIDSFESIEEFLDGIASVFVSRSPEGYKFRDARRLLNPGARSFFAMLLRWKIENIPMGLMLKNVVDYWDSLDEPIFVGRWGEIKLEGSYVESWVEIGQKTAEEKINLAIVRIKDEYDYLETFVQKYVEFFHDVGLLNGDLYSELKYGTADPFEIELIKSGFNVGLAKHLLSEFSDFVRFSDDGEGDLLIEGDLIDEMHNRGENPISIFEVKLMAGL